MLDERTETILDLLIREYIRTAEPVSSEKIARKLRTVSPATIRNIFSDLTDAGYIEQPHVSGGRVPKTQGYRFYVNRILSQDEENGSVPARILELFENADFHMRKIQEEIARTFGVLSRVGNTMPVGFRELFGEPEFQEPSLVRECGAFLDEFEKQRDTYQKGVHHIPIEVLIAEENRIQPTEHMSVVLGRRNSGDLFMIAGSTRMPYDRIIHTVKLWMTI